MENFKIEEQEKLSVITINKTCKTWQLPIIIKNSFTKLIQYIVNNYTKTDYVPYVKYYNLNWNSLKKENFLFSIIKVFTQSWDVEIGLPIQQKLPDNNEIKYKEISSFKAISFIHKGPYKKIGNTYKKTVNNIDKNKYKLKNVSYEFYLNDPRYTNEKDLETKILIPINE